MSKSNKDNKLAKDRLLKHEYDKYLEIGEIDYSQDWLEMFTPAIISDLFTIMGSCSDNQQKFEYVQEELGLYGFEPLGLGTNVYALWHPAYPGVAFKIALDTAGLADNYNDEILYGLVNKILVDAGKKPRYNKCLVRHPTGIVSVQERKILMKSQDRLDTFRGSILKTLNLLAEHFLIVDLSPTLFPFNYGIDRNGDWCFIDASDLYPLENLKKLRCTRAIGSDKKGGVARCHGSLYYSEDFSTIICARCGKEYGPSEFRPNDKEEVSNMAHAYSDGLTADERKEMEREELDAMIHGRAEDIDVRSCQRADDTVQSYEEPEAEEESAQPEMSDKDQAILSSKMIEDDTERAQFLMDAGVDIETIADLCPDAIQFNGSDDEDGEELEHSDPARLGDQETTGESMAAGTEVVQQSEDDDEDEADDTEVEETPVVPQPKPPKVFWNPNNPPRDLMDRSGGVDVIHPRVEATVQEPPIETLRQMATSFNPVINVADDDEDEDEDDIQEVGTTPAAESSADAPHIYYSVFTQEDVEGIMVHIPKNISSEEFEALYGEYGHGIYVTNDGGKTFAEAVQASALFKLIRQAYEDLEDI